MCNRDWFPKNFGSIAKLSDFNEPVGIMEHTCEQTLEKLKQIDAITLGMPKIAYMVGWQKGGHDAQYPAWGPVEPRIKRSCDATALESFYWLYNEAKKYNTTVSVHLNMIDAHPFSPLWDLYYKYDIIAKNKDGSLRPYVWGYPISYTREWQLGFAQRRIDQLCELLPIEEAGTVRIDAFHSIVPLLEDKSCISPYLGISADEEAETQKKIISYFRTKGIDVTAEFSTQYRVDSLIGMQPQATHYAEIDLLGVPASMYCGGDGADTRAGFCIDGGVFWRYVTQTPKMEGLAGEMSKSTFIWYYLNRLERQMIDEKGTLIFEGNVKSWVENEQKIEQNYSSSKRVPGDYYVTIEDNFIRDKNDIFVPALWRDNTIVAHSDNGYKNRIWKLPENWPQNGKVKINEININGLKQTGTIEIDSKKIKLTLTPGQTIAITL